MPKCEVCGKELANPNSASHINSKFHQDAMKNVKGSKTKVELKSEPKSTSKPKKVSKASSEPKAKPEPKKKPLTKKKPKVKGKPIPKDHISKLKKLMTQQAECNIGLVGHVDHGKTSLVKALTGDWTDRHSEEQERGISIKLGYSNATILYCPECDEYLTFHMAEQERTKNQPRFTCPICQGPLDFKRNISFVDAPGHEILMATMLSGASLMDGACLLIAADEKCPQPQTREHLAALDIAGIERVIIIQNKIDAVSKGSVVEHAPIIPTSAIFGANINTIVRAFEQIIPSPNLSEKEAFQFLVARSFDINKPGREIEDLRGGVIGGSVLKGLIKVGNEIEIRPGIKVKDKYKPIKSTVVSISQGRNLLEEAKPGGLIGIGTKLDPALTKGDSLIGHICGEPNTLPEVLDEIEIEVNLLDRVIGSEVQIKVIPLRHNERLLLVVGTEKTGGIVTKILKNSYIIKLNPPICPPEDFIFAISRIINRRYRLIGYGVQIDNK
jgi:translation initiation factor 2 subunit 3